MTYDNVIEMLEEAGLPLAYDHFAEGESPDPPFLVFLFPGTDNVFADDTVYKKIDQLNIELYTDKKDPEIETTIEDILLSHELPYEKSEVWIESEKMYEVLYQTQMIGGYTTMANKKNKVKFGLNKVHYAKITAWSDDGVPTFKIKPYLYVESGYRYYYEDIPLSFSKDDLEYDADMISLYRLINIDEMLHNFYLYVELF